MKTSNKPQDEGLDIMKLIKEKDEYVVGALMALYGRQTIDEQISQATRYENSIGFNALDAGVLTSIAEQYINRGFLTQKQITFVRRAIAKYHRQLNGMFIEPKPIKQQKKTKEEIVPIKWAGSFEGGKKILIKFKTPDRAEFLDLLGKVKTLPGRHWEPDIDDKPWTCPCNLNNVKDLMDWEFEIAPKLKKWYDKMQYNEIDNVIQVKGLKMELYPFQRQGVSFIESRKGRALIGDEMGLGKTAQAIAWLQHNKETCLPAVIIVPASLKLNWGKEIEKWTDLSYSILSGRPNGVNHINEDIIIVNYDILSDRETKDEKGITINKTKGWGSILKKFKTLVLDEVHLTKGQKTKRTKAVRKLAKKAKHIIALSGTPIVNRPVEFFNCLNMIAPERFDSFWNYAKQYCAPTNNGYGWDFSGASNTEKLHKELVSTVMVRRTKNQVLKDLPAKVRTVIPIEIDLEYYNEIQEDFTKWLEVFGVETTTSKDSNAEALVRIEKLKQIAVKGKMNGMIEWIENFLDSDQKLVVFATHHKTIDDLMSHFGSMAVKLDGRDSAKNKEAAVEAFQSNNNIRLFIGNVKAAGLGITLTAASSTCFTELGWTPGEHDQAEDRVHRIGQEADSVNAYYLLAHHTIEEDIAELIDEKRRVLDQVLDGKEVAEESLLKELLDRMVKKIIKIKKK